MEDKLDIPLKRTHIVILLALFSCFLWGSAFPTIKLGYRLFGIDGSDTFGKIIFAGYRFFISGIMIFIFCLLTKRKIGVNKSQIKRLLLLGLLQTTINYAFFYIGLSNTSGTKGSIIMGTTTLFAVIIARIFYKEDKLTLNKMLGLILGFIGVIIVNIGGSTVSAGFSLTGEGFVLISAFTGAISSVYTKSLTKDINSFLVAGYQLLLGALFLLLAGFIGGAETLNFTSQNIWLLLYLAFASAAAFSIWTSLLKYNPVGKIEIYRFTIPIFGVVLSYILLDERLLGTKTLLAVILVSLSIIFINLDKKRIRRDPF